MLDSTTLPTEKSNCPTSKVSVAEANAEILCETGLRRLKGIKPKPPAPK